MIHIEKRGETKNENLENKNEREIKSYQPASDGGNSKFKKDLYQ